jgi:hypothetical protein
MTQYMLSVHHEGTTPPYANDEEMQASFEATGVFNQKLKDAGSWVFAGGLHPIESATTVDGRGETVVVTDGPFSESKEYLGGFWVIDAPDLDAAMKLAAEGSKACRAAVEVRPFDGA